MRRAALLAVFGSVLLGTFAGVAWAADIFCTGGRCDGTELSDFITGTAQRDRIFALGGFDEVFALAGEDELNGQNGGDDLLGGNNNDTYNGGNGSDFLSESFSFFNEQPVTSSGRDVMNGGEGTDFMEGNTGADILRGQDGDECFERGGMFGDQGNDQLYGNAGEDCLVGEEGTDEHYGGADNDFIDAVQNDTDPETGEPLGTHDLVDCGGGVDTAFVNLDEDIVRANCENVEPTPIAQPTSAGTTAEEQQQLGEAFRAEHGL